MVELRLTCHVDQCQCLKEMPQHLCNSSSHFVDWKSVTKKGYFWKSLAPAIHQAVLKYHIDAVNSAYLQKMDKIDCGDPLPRVHHYDGATGFHTSLGPDRALKNEQCWVHFSQYCWKRCVIGTKTDYSSALNRVDWQQALQHGDLPSLQQTDSKDPLIFCPASNTEYLNVAAYLEAFWGCLASHMS